MTQTNAGSNNSAGQSGQSPDPGAGQNQAAVSGAKRLAILVASIGAVAVVVAAAIQVLPDLFDGDGPGPGPSATSVPNGTSEVSATSTVNNDPCDLDRLENAGESWVRPPAQRSNAKLFADKEPRVLTKVDADDNPGISVRGQINLSVPAGQVLYLVRQPDRNTEDQEGHPGSHQYYPAAPVTPDSDGCWEDGSRPLGYDGAKGITEIYYLFLVSGEQADRFSRDRSADEWDGYNYSQWQSVGAIDVLEFRVPTVT